MPPSYFYHLKFEVYPNPLTGIESNPGPNTSYWLPDRNTDIFGSLPQHPRHQQFPPPHTPLPQRHPEAQPKSTSAIIDCGVCRIPQGQDESNISRLSAKNRAPSFPPPPSTAAINPYAASRDWRFSRLHIEGIDSEARSNETTTMSSASTAAAAATSVGPSMGNAGRATKAKYVPLATRKTDLGWGIVHLYREEHETPEPPIPSVAEMEAFENQDETSDTADYTTLCIPAVPSYLSPSDFLGFIGEKWRDHITHYRMIMTGRLNRYLVLLKFRNNVPALRFRRDFDGQVFNEIEPETCHVTVIRSITFETPTRPNGTFPDLSHDPFTPSYSTAPHGSLKPFPPPTPNLIELPTCPVCLERMDDTMGLLTIPCQHVFHCSCLQKWKGSGCPVCRHTNPSSSAGTLPSSSQSTAPNDPSNPYTQPFGAGVTNLCNVCDSPEDLWICLICGNVGCGRYKGGHAKDHWKETAHTFALELDTQYVWDYAGDSWVHRLIRDKGDEKVMELPGHNEGTDGQIEHPDVVPRAKLDSIGIEYTHLLTSQLESQRVYFEEMLSKAADKATKAAAATEMTSAQASKALEELRVLKQEHQQMKTDTIPNLEKDLARERTRATKSTDLARGFSKSLQEEKKVSEGLMKRIEHVNKELGSLGENVQALKLENADLKDQNHDLSMFISGQEKLKELEAEGQMEEGEILEGSATVPEEKRKRKGKGKAK